MHWLTRDLDFGGKLLCTGSLEGRGLDFGGKLLCTGSLETWILAANCYALAH